MTYITYTVNDYFGIKIFKSKFCSTQAQRSILRNNGVANGKGVASCIATTHAVLFYQSPMSQLFCIQSQLYV